MQIMSETMSNLIFAWCSLPTKNAMRKEDYYSYTRMIQEFRFELRDSYDRKNLLVGIPDIFDRMLENKSGANWEVMKSNKIKN